MQKRRQKHREHHKHHEKITYRRHFGGGTPRTQTVEGILSITSRGNGYVAVPERKDDIEIQPSGLGVALHGDTVEVLLGARLRKQQGRITKVLLRAKEQFVGVLTKSPGEKPGEAFSYFLEADDRKMRVPIFIPETKTGGAKEGQKVVAVLALWENPKKNPEGSVIKILGKPGNHETEMKAIVYEKGFATDFPREVDEEARRETARFPSLIAEELKHRKDFRKVPTFTIDPLTAKDFDDAISIRELSTVNSKLPTWEIGIHIADVSFFVRPGTALDREAARRATSIYLVDRTIHMLPEALSADICSLKENEDRFAFSAVLTLDKNAHVLSRWFGRTIIRSQKRFDYHEAQALLDVPPKSLSANSREWFHRENLEILRDLARVLRKRRIAEGSIIFDRDELEIVLDEHKRPIAIKIKERAETMRLVEEFMLLANKEVATFVGKERLFVYRIHDLPDAEKIEELSLFLKGLGYELPHKRGKVAARDLNKLLEDIREREESGLIETAAIRSMAKAIYSTKNIGHFGLGFENYTHFTSPIRRYPDVLVHRLLATHLLKHKLPHDAMRQYEAMARYSSEKEKEAADAERESIKYKQVEYMSERIGQTFEAIISGVTEWGLYVQEKETGAEGLIHVSVLEGDYYELDQKNYTLAGKRSKKKYRLGDSVRVELLATDLAARQITYKLIEQLVKGKN